MVTNNMNRWTSAGMERSRIFPLIRLRCVYAESLHAIARPVIMVVISSSNTIVKH